MRSTAIGMHQTAIALLLMVATSMAQTMPSLTVGDVTYENVEVKKEYPSSLFIQHSSGTAFVDKAKLTREQIASLLPPTEDGEERVENSGEASPRSGIAPDEIMPGPETLATDEERAFFSACEKADTTKIKSMLAANPALVKAAMRGRWVESQQRSAAEKAAGQKGYVVIPITVSALQTLIDKSPKTPGRLEAVKALVEAGADVKAPTSKLGYQGSRNPVSLPNRLTPEELDYLLSQGADPSFGWCGPRIQPLTNLAFKFVTTKDAKEKAEAGELLRVFIKNNTDPGTQNEFGGWPAEVVNSKLAPGSNVRSAQEISDAAEDKELAAILAGN